MSKFKTAVKIKVHNAEHLSIGVEESYKPLTIPVFVSGLLALGIMQELNSGTDPFEVLSMVKEAVTKALRSNGLQLMVEMDGKNENDSNNSD